jgi:hypothetical protein
MFALVTAGLGLIAAALPVSRALLERRVATRGQLHPDRRLSPIHLTRLTSTEASYPTAADILWSRRGFLAALVSGAVLALLSLVIVVTDPRVRLVDSNDPSDTIEVDARLLFLLPLAGGALLAWWGFRLGTQIFFQREGEPATSDQLILEVAGDADALIRRCQAAFVEFGALHTRATRVSVERTKGLGLERASFVGRLRPNEQVTVEVNREADSRYSLILTSSSFKARLRTSRFTEDVEWLAESILT